MVLCLWWLLLWRLWVVVLIVLRGSWQQCQTVFLVVAYSISTVDGSRRRPKRMKKTCLSNCILPNCRLIYSSKRTLTMLKEWCHVRNILDVDQCLSSPCLNNGVCIDGFLDYSCSCVDGYLGKNCQIATDGISPTSSNTLIQHHCIADSLKVYRNRSIPDPHLNTSSVHPIWAMRLLEYQFYTPMQICVIRFLWWLRVSFSKWYQCLGMPIFLNLFGIVFIIILNCIYIFVIICLSCHSNPCIPQFPQWRNTMHVIWVIYCCLLLLLFSIPPNIIIDH